MNNAAPAPDKEAAPKASFLTLFRTGLFSGHLASIVIILVVLGITFDLLTDGLFLSARNLSLLLRQAATLMVVASGMVVLIVSGELDLSVGSAVFLVSVLCAKLQYFYQWSTLSIIPMALAAGLLLGLWQGMWVTRTAVPSFIVTLAGFLIFRGIGYVWTNAYTINPMEDSFVALSEGFVSPLTSVVLVVLAFTLFAAAVFRKRANMRRYGLEPAPMAHTAAIIALGAAGFGVFAWVVGTYQGIPNALLFAALALTALTFVAQKTVLGRNLYAIGGNREAARLAGIDVKKNLLLAFCLMGLLYGLAGILITARLNGSTPETGMNLELDAIAAAIIGGASFAGGIGTVPGAFIGALLLTAIDNGMSLLNVSSFLQMVVKGFVLLLAVTFDMASRRKGR